MSPNRGEIMNSDSRATEKSFLEKFFEAIFASAPEVPTKQVNGQTVSVEPWACSSLFK